MENVALSPLWDGAASIYRTLETVLLASQTHFPEGFARRKNTCYVTVFNSLFEIDEILKFVSAQCTSKHANLANLLV